MLNLGRPALSSLVSSLMTRPWPLTSATAILSLNLLNIFDRSLVLPPASLFAVTRMYIHACSPQALNVVKTIATKLLLFTVQLAILSNLLCFA